MYSKLQIKGNIEVKTGLHIGGSNVFSAIGAVDSPVVRDAKTKLPIIPGSSLKGKIRTLLARSRSDFLKDCNDDPKAIIRLFGGSKKDETGKIPGSRLKFSDCFMNNSRELNEADIDVTEVKFENTISRATAVANPRQIERVVRGAIFGFEVIYDADDESQIVDDFKLLTEGLKLLQYDYLGGHGSRGSGRISFSKLSVEAVYGEVSSQIISECEKILKEVE